MLQFLAERCSGVIFGIDGSRKQFDLAVERLDQRGVVFPNDFMSLKLPKESIDVVWMQRTGCCLSDC